MEQSQRRLNNPKQDIHDIDGTVQKLMNWGGGGGRPVRRAQVGIKGEEGGVLVFK